MNGILLVEPEQDVRVLLSSILRESGFEVMTRSSREDGLAILRQRVEDFSLLLLSHVSASDDDHLVAFLRTARKVAPDLPLIVLTDRHNEGFQDRIHAAGAADIIERTAYTGKNVDISMKNILHLKVAVEENLCLKKTVKVLKSNLKYYQDFFTSRYEPVGQSEAFLEVMRKAEELAFIPRPVLILGERGTGKEIVAGAIHYIGNRASAPFVTVNCASFQGELLASELFGHEKGAFTGARKRKPGRFELADGGTLFLDEIGNMPLEFQEKILRIIEYQEFELLGGTHTIRVDVRVIAATNSDIEKSIREGSFRADLYDRLTFATIEVPPLRKRLEDLEPLVVHFQEKFLQEIPHLVEKIFTKDSLDKMRAYRWPGNIRELRNVVERMVCTAKKSEISAADLPLDIIQETSTEETLPDKVFAFEKHLIVEALKGCKYNQKKSAEHLGITYDQFRHLYKKHHIKELLE